MTATPPIPPARCVDCGQEHHWRFRDRMRWHCVRCCPCPDADDAIFTWHRATTPDHATSQDTAHRKIR
jgi:hypothetical protein